MKHTYSIFGEGGSLLVWNVERLWELAKALPVNSIPISHIFSFNEPVWFESPSIASPTCKQIAEYAKRIFEVDLSYPIILSASGQVMDGLHRVAKSWVQGLQEIQAVRFTRDPEPDLVIASDEKVSGNGEMIELLNNALTRVREGRVRGTVVITIENGGIGYWTYLNGLDDIQQAVATIDRLRSDIIDGK
jgi:hypothetical protein